MIHNMMWIMNMMMMKKKKKMGTDFPCTFPHVNNNIALIDLNSQTHMHLANFEFNSFIFFSVHCMCH